MRRTHSLARDLDTALTLYALTQLSHPEASGAVLLAGVAVALLLALLEA